MKYTLLIALCALSFTGCKTKQVVVTEEKSAVIEKESNGNYGFEAMNEEWKLNVDFVNSTVTRINRKNNETVNRWGIVESLEQGEDTKEYRLKENGRETNLTLSENMKCDTVEFGKAYQITLTLKDAPKNEERIFEGCGRFLENYVLHDIWVLQSLDYMDLSGENQKPQLEFNLREGKVTGKLFCNSIIGNVLYYEDAVIFQNAATTKMMCSTMNLEDKLLKAMNSGAFAVDYLENGVELSNNLHKMRFKKVD
jgi:heat shock protein HslJ